MSHVVLEIRKIPQRFYTHSGIDVPPVSLHGLMDISVDLAFIVN